MSKFATTLKAYIIGMKHFIILLILGTIPVLSMAQPSFQKPAILNELQAEKSRQGSIQIIEDNRIDDLLARHIEINRRRDGIIGYRILIFKDGSQNSKEKAFEAKSRFLTNFPGYEVYYIYEQPESKLFVGDFRTKSDANKLKVEVEKFFRNAIVIETKINFPKLDK
jgi:hypothetical protein